MWRQVVLHFCFFSCIYAYDHEMYRNCSRIEFCSENRELTRLQRYRVVLEGSIFAKGEAILRLQRTEVTDIELYLNITAIEGNIFRVQIEERGLGRYHLQDVLDGSPKKINFDDVVLSPNSSTMVVGQNRAVVHTSPFSIEFYHGSVKQAVLEGDRLSLKKHEFGNPITFAVNFPQAARLYGLHEHAEHLALRETGPEGVDPFRIKTIDLTGFELYSTQAMYGAIPVVYGHGPNSTSGLFVHNAAEQWVDISYNKSVGGTAYFMIDSGAFDLFLLLGPSIQDVVREYTSLTGVAHLPPIWALGYHQCRWGYDNQEDVQNVIAKLDANDFPVDVIWLDIQHTDNNRYFTWNSENFSDPMGMLKNLSSTNRYLVTLSDPHFKKEEGYFIYDEGIAKNYFIKNPNGSVFEDVCWPGTSAWMDYLNPAARDYYSTLFHYNDKWVSSPTLGGIWNDMNEAAIFDEPNEKTFPYNVVHHGGVLNQDIHNMYGFLQTMATHKGLMARDNGTVRPFILTRAHFAGSQRYAAFWTGDNSADWGFITIGYSMCLSANLLGISFCGSDTGGFWGEPSDEMLQRYYQANTWLPFFREHSALESKRREPYLYSKEVQEVIRRTIKARYQHLPVWYTLFYEQTLTGAPLIRPLFYHYPNDTEVYDIDDQLLVGSDILVKAVAEPGVESVQVYFPGGKNLTWFSIELDNVTYAGTGWTKVPVTIQNIPVFYRQGSIIPTKIPGPSTTAMKNDGYLLIALLDEALNASGRLYIDDTSSFDYLHFKKYNYISVEVHYEAIEIREEDGSDSEGLELFLYGVQIIAPEKTKDGSPTGRYTKTLFEHTRDGTPLRDIKLGGKKPLHITL